jgi:predicted membrane chloride channel (bestrophin family)
MHAFNQAKKISTIPFPFPYAQTVTYMLFAFTVTLPVLMVAMVSSSAMAGLLSGVTVWSYLALNEVSTTIFHFLRLSHHFRRLSHHFLHVQVNRELEDPFFFPPNDLPLVHMQIQLNKKLAVLDPEERRQSWANLCKDSRMGWVDAGMCVEGVEDVLIARYALLSVLV